MIRFLVNKPVAVMMSFLAAIILGVITYFTLPVSLLPDVAIPEITVQVSKEGTSARQLENTVVRQLRLQLMQVAHVSSMESRTRDGVGIIRLRFDYGTDTDYAFIDVNEKIDMAMANLQDVDRPRVVKASATDLPIFNVNLTLKSDVPYEETQRTKFLELSEYATTVISRRMEQLPEVAMVDMTGVEKQEVAIVPFNDKMSQAGISLSELERILTDNNVEAGSITARDGYYEYNVKISSTLRTVEDIKNISFVKEGRLYHLSDMADVSIVAQDPVGYSYYNGKRAIVFSVIKQADASMEGLKKSMNETLEMFREQYPDMSFDVSQNQTDILDYTMENLQSNLWIGFLLICVTALLFFKDMRTPAIISLGMVVSLIVSMLFFYLFGLSLNIISLSGLILAMGMMIDNSIIVTDNIAQYREKDGLLDESCVKGTNEIITPLLSSMLTTVAVFVPLVFISGIAGAIFMDQAMSITIGLAVAYVVGIIFLPVAYKIFYSSRVISRVKAPKFIRVMLEKMDTVVSGWRVYDRGFDYVFKHRRVAGVFMLLIVPVVILLFNVIDKSKMPYLDYNESVVTVEWNENIHVKENARRMLDLARYVDSMCVQNVILAGEQQFVLSGREEYTSSEAQMYVKSSPEKSIIDVEEAITSYIFSRYPHASVTIGKVESVFEKIFETDEAGFVARVSRPASDIASEMEDVVAYCYDLARKTGGRADISLSSQVDITVDNEAMALYGVSASVVKSTIRSLFGQNNVTTLRSDVQYLPMVISWEEKSINELLSTTMINTARGGEVPLSAFIKVSGGQDFKSIYASRDGEYIPIYYDDVKDVDKLTREINSIVKTSPEYDVKYAGSIFSNKLLFEELIIVLLISVLLLYFILAAQFESLSQPLIVLLELPIDIAASLLVLWACGHTLNVMSAIGIIVSCGIIINDSILKIDVINTLRREGMSILEAIHTAGHRRLRAIVMTSLTTVFALLPVLFTSDIGSELQAPLALSMIGGMVIGTMVSLYVIPLIYWFIYRNSKNIRNVSQVKA
ncbi:MAG: efflux RND transporter permease subunit [Flavobacteriales bacterium]|nr:efflux RND transporter permease subunit [Flavobacteriales bacterium]